MRPELLPAYDAAHLDSIADHVLGRGLQHIDGARYNFAEALADGDSLEAAAAQYARSARGLVELNNARRALANLHERGADHAGAIGLAVLAFWNDGIAAARRQFDDIPEDVAAAACPVEFAVADLSDPGRDAAVAVARLDGASLLPRGWLAILGALAERGSAAEATALAAEGFTALPWTPAPFALPDPNADQNSEFDRYRARVADIFAGFDVSVVLVLRSVDSYAESLYLQRFKNVEPSKRGHRRLYRRSFAEFRFEARALWDYDAIIEGWEKHFSSVSIVNFHDGSVVDNFAAAAGIPTQAVGEATWVNVSADPRIGLWLRDAPFTDAESRRTFGWSEQSRALVDDQRVTTWESEQARTEFRQRYASRRLGPDYFPEPRAAAFHPELTPAERERIAAGYFSVLSSDISGRELFDGSDAASDRIGFATHPLPGAPQ